jgi:hypothetical protein
MTLGDYLERYRAIHGTLPPIGGGAGAAVSHPAVRPQQEGYGAVEAGVAPGLVIPFDQASHIVIEEGPRWSAVEQAAGAARLKQEPLPANGYLRNVWWEVTTEVAGVETAGTIRPNRLYPYNIIGFCAFQDQGGHTISGLSGMNWRLANLAGGYNAMLDFSQLEGFSATIKAPAFYFLIPCAMSATGFGALTNMTEATHYQIQPELAALTTVFSVNPTTAPKLRIQTWLELWPLPQARTQPEAGYPEGRQQEQRPPMEGTIQYWTEQSNISISAGSNQIRFSRVGQMIRTHLFVTTNTEGELISTVMANPIQYYISRVAFRTIGTLFARNYFLTFMPQSFAAFPPGVYPVQYSSGQGKEVGDNDVNTWEPTVNASRLELYGQNWGVGLLTIITNDVAVGAVSEVGRREVPGQTAFHPPLGIE